MKNGTIPVIRQREKINQEYSDIVIELGKFVVEAANMQHARDNMTSREIAIANQRTTFLDRIKELAEEMQDRDKEDAKLAALEKARQPDLVPSEQNEMSQ